VSATHPIATLLRQRLPFLSLLVFAICGIAISSGVRIIDLWLAAALLTAAAFFATGKIARSSR
jgi:uncharacterized membrane protein YoaK (UPF0700 family)